MAPRAQVARVQGVSPVCLWPPVIALLSSPWSCKRHPSPHAASARASLASSAPAINPLALRLPVVKSRSLPQP